MPLGMLRTISAVASFSDIKPEQAVALATGNTARVYGLSRGIIAPEYEADLLLVDTPIGSVANTALKALEIGDLPGIAAVIIDGEVKTGVSRNTPPPRRKAIIH